MNDEQQQDGIWVLSDINPDGTSTYMVTVQVDKDTALSLKADDAVRYVSTVYRAAAIAEHDAAVLKQLHGRLKLDAKTAGQAIVDMRQDREPINVVATAQLRYQPIVSALTMGPYVDVWVGDRHITQWTPEDCFQHGSQVLRVLAGVDLDAGYYRYLLHTIGVDAPVARGAVNDLGNYGLRERESRDPHVR